MATEERHWPSPQVATVPCPGHSPRIGKQRENLARGPDQQQRNPERTLRVQALNFNLSTSTRPGDELAEVNGTSHLLSFEIKDGRRDARNGSIHEQDVRAFVLHCELIGAKGVPPLTPKLRQAHIIWTESQWSHPPWLVQTIHHPSALQSISLSRVEKNSKEKCLDPKEISFLLVICQ